MSQLSLFLIELAICFLARGVVVLVLTGPLRKVLVDACGTAERARFYQGTKVLHFTIRPG